MELRAAGRTTLLVLSVAGIGVVDYFTGPNVAFSLFYLVPVAWGAWAGSNGLGFGLALLAAGSWMAAEAAWNGVNPISVWNGFTRLGIFVAMALLLGRVRRDAQEVRALNAQLHKLLEHEQHLARTDSLTGLPNRRMFVDALRRAGARVHRTGKPIAIVYIDLDGFKTFNDRMGHAAGDVVLRRVSVVLAAHVRGSDVAARLGGAQFSVLLDQCTEDASRSTATRLLDQLIAALSDVAGGTVGVSIGVACFDSALVDVETMIDHADAAMYCAKGHGRNRIFVTRLAGAGPRSPVLPTD